MKRSVRRAGAFALVGGLALTAPLLEEAAALPFALVAAVAFAVGEGPLFELFARPADREEGRLRGLFGFALSAAVLGGLVPIAGLPTAVFAGTVLLVAVGNFGAELVRATSSRVPTAGFVAGGIVGAAVGLLGVGAIGRASPPIAEVAFLSVVGALLGALIRSMLFPRDEPPVVFSVGLSLWLLAAIGAGAEAGLTGVAAALAVTGGFGALSYALDTASVEGMVSGVLLGLLAVVLAGYEWFALLILFFGVGGLSTKFRYDRKRERGIAEDDGGARGGTNVLANSTAAMIALLCYAATGTGLIGGDPTLYLFAFAGAVATALADTLSSEIGGTFGGTRLITTLEPVPPGTDGGVTWQGALAGLGGAALVAGGALALFPAVQAIGALFVVLAGVAGMTVDSLLGATLEGRFLGNEGVNFLSTVAGALVALVATVVAGIATLPSLPVVVA